MFGGAKLLPGYMTLGEGAPLFNAEPLTHRREKVFSGFLGGLDAPCDRPTAQLPAAR